MACFVLRKQLILLLAELVPPCTCSCWSSTHHDSDISDALKGVVHTPIGHLNQNLLDGLLGVLGADTLSSSKLFGFGILILVNVNANDPGRSCYFAAHNNSQPNSSQTKHSTRRARLHLGVRKESWAVEEKFVLAQEEEMQVKKAVIKEKMETNIHGYEIL